MASKTQIRASQLTGSMPSSVEGASAAPAIADLAGVLDHMASSIARIHGASVFSNSAAGVFAQDILPDADGSRDLGSTTAEFAEVHANSVLSQVAMAITAADGDLSVTADGSDNKVVIKGDHTSGAAIHLDGNAAAGSIVDIDAGVLDMDATGAATLDAGGAITLTGAGILLAGGSSEIDITTTGALDLNGAAVTVDASSTLSLDAADSTNLTMVAGSSSSTDKVLTIAASNSASSYNGNIDMDADGEIFIDALEGISIDAAAASNLSTSAGDLTLEAGGSSNKVVVKGDSTSGVAIHLDANEGSSSEIHMEAGVIDMDTGSLTLDATSTIGITGAGVDINAGSSTLELTSSGAVDINGAAVTVDGTTLSLDGTDSTNLTMVAGSSSGSDKVLTIAASNSASSYNGNIDVDADGEIFIDALEGISIDAAADSNFTLSDGDLSLIADGSDNKVVIKGDHESGVAVHIDANAAAGAILDIDAGALDIDVTAAATIDAVGVAIGAGSGELDLTTTGAMDLNSAAFTLDATTVSIDGSGVLNIDTSDASNGITIGTGTSGVPVSIGHGTSEVTVNDNLTVTGDLTINGATTTVSTTNMVVEDKFIELGNGVSGTPSGDAGFVIERGSSSNVALIWDESEDEFVLGSGSVTGASTGNLTLTPSDLQVGSFRATKLEIDGANDSIDVSTDMVITAAADITLAAGGANVKPNADNTIALGVSGTGFSDLFLSSGAVVDFSASDITMTHSSNLLAIAGGNTRVDRLEIDGANDYIDVSTDLQIIAAADIKLDPAGGEVVVDGNIVPDTDSTDSLGALQTTVSTTFASYYQSQTVTSATEFIALQDVGSDGIASAAVGDTMTLSDGSSTLTATVDVAFGTSVSQTGQWHDGNSGASPSTMGVSSPSGQIVFSYSSLPQRLKDCIGGVVVFGDSSNKLNGVVQSVNTSSNTVTIGTLSNNQGSGTLSMSSINQSELTCRGFGISSVSFSAGSSLALSGGVTSAVLRGSLKAWSSVVADNIRIPGTGLMYFDADQNSSLGSPANDIIGFNIGASAKMALSGSSVAPATNDGYALGHTLNRWSDLFMADSAVLNLGNDADVTLTHIPDSGVRLNGAMKLEFRDSAVHVSSDADGYLNAQADTGVNINVAGTDELAVTAAGSTFGGNIAIPDNGTVGNASIAAMLTLAASNVTVASGADFTIAKTSGLVLGSTAVTSTGTELNLLDAGSAGSSVALVDADSFIMGDASASNQTKKVLMSDIKTYVGGGRSKKSMTVANAVSSGVKFPMLGVDNDGGADADLSDIYLNGQLMLSGTAASNGDYKIHGSLSEASSSSFSLASSPSSYSASSSSLTLQSSLTAVNAAKLSVGTVLKYTDSSSNVGLATVTAEPASGASSVSVSIVMSTGSSFSQSASTVTITESLRNGVVFFFALEVDDVVTQVNV